MKSEELAFNDFSIFSSGGHLVYLERDNFSHFRREPPRQHSCEV